MFGKVTKYFKDKGFGFIMGDDKISYFVHRSDIQDGYLEKGYMVDFAVTTDKNDKQKAANVIVIESDNDEYYRGKR